MLVKAGVDISRLKRKIRRTLCVVHSVFAKHGIEMVIVSTYEGNHSPCSLHYANDAYDVRWKVEYPSEMIDEIRKKLGKDFNVVLEKDHLHIEYNPKLDK